MPSPGVMKFIYGMALVDVGVELQLRANFKDLNVDIVSEISLLRAIFVTKWFVREPIRTSRTRC